MKKLITFVSIILISATISAQEIIKSKADFKKLTEQQIQYKTKPLTSFLNNLKVEIKSITYQKEGEANSNQIILRFDDRISYNSKRKENVIPSRITIQFMSDKFTKAVFNNLKEYGTIEKCDDIKDFIQKIQTLKVFSISGQDDMRHQK